MKKHQFRLAIILILVIVAGVINFKPSLIKKEFPLKYGLDLAGGTQVLLQADMSKLGASDRPDALESVKEVISRRVDLFGISESTIRTQQSGDNYQIAVELPGLTDPQKALELIGTTAQLKFKTPLIDPNASPSAEAQLLGFIDTDLTGSDLKKTSVTFDQNNAQPSVSLEFNAQGAEKFAKLTRENLQKPIAIFLDDQFITAPIVQTEIVSGQAVITGNYTLDEAKALSIQLNAGALPVPVSIVSQKTITATLGADSINQSLRAGMVGLAIVAVFMIIFYGWLGVFAVLSLCVYALISLSLYRLIPVTLTLPGIAGFLLSIGMAVDSNILIFERYKEELAAGKPWAAALELAFGRAWDSIRDANLSTLSTAFILFNPLNWSFLATSGPVRGFALTLVLGIAVSLFTGIVVSRTLLRLFYRGPRYKQIATKS